VFVAHYSVAFAVKRTTPRAPLWVLALGVQLVDILWAVFVLGGIEHLRLVPGLASNPFDLYDMPYTHSLLGTAAWAALAAMLAWWWWRSVAVAGALAAAVLSHWFLDVLVHRPDMTLAGGTTKLGLSLWEWPRTEYALELLLLGATMVVCSQNCKLTRAGRFFAVLAVVQTAVAFGPLPPSIPALLISVLVFYFSVAWAATRLDAVAR